MIRTHNIVLSLLVGGGVTTGAAVQAQTAPDAMAILEKTSVFARSLKTVYGDFVSTMTAPNAVQPEHTQVWAEPPNKMAKRTASPDGVTAFYMNAAQTTIYTQMANKYVTMQRQDPTITGDLMRMIEAGFGPVPPGQADSRQIALECRSLLAPCADLLHQTPCHRAG